MISNWWYQVKSLWKKQGILYEPWTELAFQPDKKNRKAGGLTQGTYKAVCRRGGVYKSAALGNINFNDELSGPLYREISIAWDKVFK